MVTHAHAETFEDFSEGVLHREIQRLLNRLPMVAQLSPAEKNELTACFGLIHLQAGETAFREGEPARNIYWLAEGMVKLVKQNENKSESLIRVVARAAILEDLSALLSRWTHRLTCRALMDSSCLVLEADLFRKKIMNHSGAGAVLVERLMEYMEDSYFFQETAVLPVEERIRVFLNRLLSKSEMVEKSAEGYRLVFPLTRREVAAATLTTVETAIRVFRKWVKKGWIEEEKNLLILKHPSFWDDTKKNENPPES